MLPGPVYPAQIPAMFAVGRATRDFFAWASDIFRRTPCSRRSRGARSASEGCSSRSLSSSSARSWTLSYQPGDEDPLVRVLDQVQQPGRASSGARQRGGVHAVRVLGERPHGQLEVDHPLDAEARRRASLRCRSCRTPRSRRPTLKRSGFFSRILQVGAPDLLLALEAELDVARGLPVDLDVGLDELEPGDELPLVVRDASAVEPAVADLGLERRGLPQLERDLRLDIVVVVEEDGLATTWTTSARRRRGAAHQAARASLPSRLSPRSSILTSSGALLDPLLLRRDARLRGEPHDVLHEAALVLMDVISDRCVDGHCLDADVCENKLWGGGLGVYGSLD